MFRGKENLMFERKSKSSLNKRSEIVSGLPTQKQILGINLNKERNKLVNTKTFYLAEKL